jgi:diacylglycerol kinase family enzyme
MQIALILNPRSGRGGANDAAEKLCQELKHRDHRVAVLEMQADPTLIESAIDDADRVVVLGGDGTVHHLLPILAKTQTPMYHMGFGTANLIAKTFKMLMDTAKVADALEADHAPMAIDLPTCNGHPFLIMVSLGIDASVIHRFEDSRKLKGGYRAYIQPIIREFFSPRPAHFVVETNTQHEKHDSITGNLVVANLRSYGGGFDPCPDADPSDSQLDAVTIPCTTTLGAVFNYALLRFRRSSRKMKRMASGSFTISPTSPCPVFVQVDGEKATSIPGLKDGVLCFGEQLHIVVGDQSINVHATIVPGPMQIRVRLHKSDNVSSVKLPLCSTPNNRVSDRARSSSLRSINLIQTELVRHRVQAGT